MRPFMRPDRILFIGFSLLGACRHAEEVSTDPCQDRCGKYTRCNAGQCVVDYSSTVCQVSATELPASSQVSDLDQPDEHEEVDCDTLIGAAYVQIEDTNIPQYRQGRERAGEDSKGRLKGLTQSQLEEQVRGLENSLYRCIDRASCQLGQDLGAGTLTFDIDLDPSGKVAGVSVQPSENYAVLDVVPCARKAAWDHRFASFDGSRMQVHYNLELH